MELDDPDVQHAVFVKGSQRLERPTSITHWQLRDLISAAEDSEDAFYCVHESSVVKHNAASRKCELATALEFSANSMTVRHGFLAAGGMNGQLLVYDLAEKRLCFSGSVGSTVNNALHIGRHSNGDSRLFVCCNDSTIKVFRLPSMERVTVINCPCPINYAALSADGGHLAAVGDCETALLFAAGPAGYSQVAAFTEAADVGMCAAWNSHGSAWAACHQDGTVAVWDRRSGGCVLRTVLPSAARCLKFAPAPLDLLAVAEHEDRLTLLDCRQWSRRQVLTVTPPEEGSQSPCAAAEPGISGLAFSPSGQRLWVGVEECCWAFDVDTLKRRTFSTAAIL